MELPTDGVINTTGDVDDSYIDINSVLNDSVVNASNFSLDNTYLIYPRPWYPSGYTVPHIVIASILVTVIMIIVVVGNMLVIIAIATEKSLKNIQNWFIASLAVADFFLGLVIMPFSLANELMGYWTFGNMWCDIHSAMDVLLSTASIMNLCLISLDRYWSITQAIDYLKKRTPARALFMIAFVWVASGLICIPPLLGWKVDRLEEKYPKCQLSEDIGYVLYSALGSFYIPSCIMVFVYIRIYFAAKARARRGIRKVQKPIRPPEQVTSFTIESETADRERRFPFPHSSRAVDRNSNSPIKSVVTIETISPSVPAPPQIPIVTCDFASDVSTSDNMDGNNATEVTDSGLLDAPPKDTLKVMGAHPLSLAAARFRGSTLSVAGDSRQSTLVRIRTPSVGVDTDMVSEFDPSSSDSGVASRCAVVKPLKMRLCKPIFGRRASKAKRDVIDLGRISQAGPSAVAHPHELAPKMPKARDPEREKRRIARKKEKRATLILGLIMGSFIACWLPFFVLYILTPICGTHCNVPKRAFAFAFWLGYTNSALNPVIYTIFNKDFRRAFRRILFK